MRDAIQHTSLTTITIIFFFSSRRRHTRFKCDWSSDVCSSDLSLPVATCVCPLENKSVSLAHLAASSSNAFLFFNLAFSAPPGPFLPSNHPHAYSCDRAAPAIVGSLSEKTFFGKDGLWTQPTLFGRGELLRMVQPMHRLRCALATN